MQEFIILAHPGKENICKPAQNKYITVSEFKSENDFQAFDFYIMTQNYIQPLEESSQFIYEYPELIQYDQFRPHQRPEVYVVLKPKASDKEITIFFNIKAQIKFPIDCVPFTFKVNEFHSASQVFDKFKANCPIKYTKIELTSNFNGSSVNDLLQFLRKNQIMCIINIAEDFPDCHYFAQRSILIEEFIKTEQDFIQSLSQLHYFWQPFLIKENLISKNDANFVFNSFKSTASSHNKFIQVLKQRHQSVSENIVDILCDIDYFFNSTLDLFQNYPSIDLFFKIKNQNQAFQNKINSALNQKNSNEIWSLFDLLIQPVSNYNNFFLFILKLKALTPSYHRDFIFFDEAGKIITEFNNKIRTWISKEPGSLTLLVELQSKLTDKTDIMSVNRTLLNSYGGKAMSSPGNLYIFNDLILITKLNKNGESVLVKSDGCDFRYTTNKDQNTIGTIDKKSIKFQFLNENMLESALNQIEEIKLLFYSKLRVLERLMIATFVDGTENMEIYSEACAITIDNEIKGEKNSLVYLIGGQIDGKYARNVSIYNIKNNDLQIIYNPLEGRTGHAATSYNKIIYSFGGIGSNQKVMNDFVSIDTKSQNVMHHLTSSFIPPPRYGHTLVNIDNFLMLYGGKNANGNFLSDYYAYSIKNSQWKVGSNSSSDIIQARAFHSAVVINDLIVIHGGLNENGALNDVFAYNIKRNYWTNVQVTGDILFPRHSHKAIAFNDWMIIIGGTNQSGVILPPVGIKFDDDKAQAFNFASGGNDRPNLINFSLVLNDQSLLIFGGKNKDTDTNSAGIITTSLPKIVIPAQEQQSQLNFKKGLSKMRNPFQNNKSTQKKNETALSKQQSTSKTNRSSLFDKGIIKNIFKFKKNRKESNPFLNEDNAFVESLSTPNKENKENALDTTTPYEFDEPDLLPINLGSEITFNLPPPLKCEDDIDILFSYKNASNDKSSSPDENLATNTLTRARVKKSKDSYFPNQISKRDDHDEDPLMDGSQFFTGGLNNLNYQSTQAQSISLSKPDISQNWFTGSIYNTITHNTLHAQDTEGSKNDETQNPQPKESNPFLPEDAEQYEYEYYSYYEYEEVPDSTEKTS